MQRFKQLPLIFFALLALANTLTAPQHSIGQQHVYYSSAGGGAVSNRTSETSIFTGDSSHFGSTRTIRASPSASPPFTDGVVQPGMVFRVKAFGNINTTGTPTLQMKVKLNSTTIADTGAVVMANNTSGRFFLEFDINVIAVSAGGSVNCFPHLQYAATGSGLVIQNHHVAAAATAINFTSAQTIDITFQWSAASASNNISLFGLTIERLS
jgi:hypothetical protein